MPSSKLDKNKERPRNTEEILGQNKTFPTQEQDQYEEIPRSTMKYKGPLGYIMN